MAKIPGISRRDFLNGCALSLAAGTSLSPIEILAREQGTRYYPPALTGMRGSHPGSFEVAHALSLTGAKFGRPRTQTDRTFDLVVVGGGISGLAAAFLYRQRAGADQRVLIIDNHDDFGGHAKRNEFVVDGRKLIGYGGSMTIDGPAGYSAASKKLIADIGIDVDRFHDYFDQGYFSRRKARPAIYFASGAYGRDVTAPSLLASFRGGSEGLDVDETVTRSPLDGESRRALVRLLTEAVDYLPQLEAEEKFEYLRTISYSDFLRRHAAVPEPVVSMLRDTRKGWWGVGWDAVSARQAVYEGMPGTSALGLGDLPGQDPAEDEPYIHHFPDGNAGVARLLVRQLNPDAVPGATMEDVVTAVVDYERLDEPGQPVRIRLNSTAVDVRHDRRGKSVEVTYVRDGHRYRVRGRHAVLACYNPMIPDLCPEIPSLQVEAIRQAEKVPLVYVNVAVRNWRAWANLGTQSIYQPRSPYMHTFEMDYPVSMGGYRYTQDPDTPTVLHGSFIPVAPDKGLTDKQQYRQGKRRLYEMSFDEHEAHILGQLDGSLSSGGFDAERDIAAITVNRWPHGYAYEYNELFTPADYGRYKGPHIAGRARIGRISIANSDASAYAFIDGAIDAADRAVDEQLAAS